VGIQQSRSVCLSRIAGKIPGTATLPSLIRRLSRFLDNLAIRVRDWYEPIARQWIQSQAASLQQVRLIVDGTKIGFTYQLLIVSLAYRQRAIPIAWTWVRNIKGHSSSDRQLSLLGYVHSLLPRGMAVLLVGDCEFGAVEILRQLDRWHWDYVLRQKTSTHTCLATNLPDLRLALQAYARRMWIEEMFGDLKRHGFDLETTMLRHARRLSRLTLAVALLYVWCIAVGTHTIRAGRRHLVDRKDRRDLSIFQIGLRYLEHQLINGLSFQIPLCCAF